MVHKIRRTRVGPTLTSWALRCLNTRALTADPHHRRILSWEAHVSLPVSLSGEFSAVRHVYGVAGHWSDGICEVQPPSLMLVTPSGRFQPNTKLCLSMTDFHPESWWVRRWLSLSWYPPTASPILTPEPTLLLPVGLTVQQGQCFKDGLS